MLSNPSAYNELLSSYSNLLTAWCYQTAEQIKTSDFLLSTFLMTDYDSTSRAALAARYQSFDEYYRCFK